MVVSGRGAVSYQRGTSVRHVRIQVNSCSRAKRRTTWKGWKNLSLKWLNPTLEALTFRAGRLQSSTRHNRLWSVPSHNLSGCDPHPLNLTLHLCLCSPPSGSHSSWISPFTTGCEPPLSAKERQVRGFWKRWSELVTTFDGVLKVSGWQIVILTPHNLSGCDPYPLTTGCDLISKHV